MDASEYEAKDVDISDWTDDLEKDDRGVVLVMSSPPEAEDALDDVGGVADSSSSLDDDE